MTRATGLREFRADLAAGRGRAWLAAVRSRGRGLEREIERACLHDLAFDAQCEGSRADWLFELASVARRRETIRRRLLRSLRRTEPQEHSWTLVQRLELASRFAEHGDVEARDAVLQFSARNAAKFSGHSDESVLRAAGAEGFKGALRLFAEAAASKSPWAGAHDLELLIRVAVERLGRRTTDRGFSEVARELPVLARLRDSGRVKRRRRRIEPLRWSKDELEQILAGKRRMSSYMLTRWGRTAPNRPLERLDRRFVTETDERVLERLLAVFRDRRMKHGIDRALELAARGNSSISRRALQALATTEDRRARAIALDRVATGPVATVSISIKILAQRPLQNDWRILEPRIVRIRRPHDVHAVAWELRDWSRGVRGPQAVPALTWAWDHTPCSKCRERVLRLLPRRQWPRRIAREARHDASPEVRELAGLR